MIDKLEAQVIYPKGTLGDTLTEQRDDAAICGYPAESHIYNSLLVKFQDSPVLQMPFTNAEKSHLFYEINRGIVTDGERPSLLKRLTGEKTPKEINFNNLHLLQLRLLTQYLVWQTIKDKEARAAASEFGQMDEIKISDGFDGAENKKVHPFRLETYRDCRVGENLRFTSNIEAMDAKSRACSMADEIHIVGFIPPVDTTENSEDKDVVLRLVCGTSTCYIAVTVEVLSEFFTKEIT